MVSFSLSGSSSSQPSWTYHQAYKSQYQKAILPIVCFWNAVASEGGENRILDDDAASTSSSHVQLYPWICLIPRIWYALQAISAIEQMWKCCNAKLASTLNPA